MKTIDEPIQLVEGCITCPHCAGGVVGVGVGKGESSIIPCFLCVDCDARMGLYFFTCSDDHTHVSWVEIPAADRMVTHHRKEEEEEEVEAADLN